MLALSAREVNTENVISRIKNENIAAAKGNLDRFEANPSTESAVRHGTDHS